MANTRIIVFICCLLTGSLFSADLRPNDLKLTLAVDQKNISNNEIVPMRLTIENTTNHRGNILIPYGQNFGKSLFQFRLFQIDSMGKYNLLYTSSVDLQMDTSIQKATEGFWQLKPGEKFTQPFYINDLKNANKRVESSIKFPSLISGNFAVQVLYLPENSNYFRYAFMIDSSEDPIPEDAEQVYPDHFRWEGSLASNFVDITVNEHSVASAHSVKHHCRLCRNIEKENWNYIKRNWDKWYKHQNHSAIRWVYDGPQSVNMSLPAFASFTAIVQTRDGITYVWFTYQLGKIYKFRSRLASVFHAVGFRKSPFKTSKVRWQKLIRVTPL